MARDKGNSHTETLLIAGIDPGTTMGYALLDLEGNIVELNSSKLLDLNKLIKLISGTGLPVMVAADKSPVPRFVEKAATRLGARLVYPEHNMLVKEKQQLSRGFEPGDDHQRDALAAAIYAFRQIRSLLVKIDNYTRKNNKQELNYSLKRLLINNETMPIKSAAKLLESKGTEHKAVIKKVIEKRDITKEYFRLHEKLESIKKENRMISMQRNSLLKRIDELKRTQPVKKTPDSPSARAGRALKFKDQKIASLQSQLKKSIRSISMLESKLSDISRLMLMIDDYRVIRILDNLGYNEYKKKSSRLKLKKDDVLLVKDASVVSTRTIKSLKPIIEIIITEKPSRLLDGFTIINPKDLNIIKMRDFALAEKKALENILKKKRRFEKMITDYKKKRHG